VSTSQIFGAIDQMVAVAKSVLPGTCDVFDGPITVQSPEQDFLLVGVEEYRPGSVQPVSAVDGTSDWAGLGAQRRDETFTIHNTYVAWSGDPTFSTARARAHTNIGLIETALRGSAFALNGALNNPGWVALQITRVRQVNAGNGIQVHVQFGAVCRGRI
jgi:hypothetical protein